MVHARTYRASKLAIVLALALAALLLGVSWAVAACSRTPASLSASLGQQVILSPGQTVSITGESLSLRFVDVVNDSRCPTGVT